MPTIVRASGFEIRIYPPPREHGPAHVHVHHAGGFVKIQLASGQHDQAVLMFRDMRAKDVVKAWRLVERYTDELLLAWEVYHGKENQ